MKRALPVLLLLLFSVFVSCKKETTTPQLTEDQLARNELYNIMKDWYLWYDQMPDIDVNNYDTPQDLLEALRYKPLDKWSFVTTVDAFQSYFKAGEYLGFGFGYNYDETGDVYTAFVFKDSELYTYGVRRGWKISAIDGQTIQPFQNLGPLMGEDVAGVSRTFSFVKPDLSTQDITVTKDTVTINSVLLADTLHVAGHIVAHLVFQTFIDPSAAELDSAFSYFQSVGADRLIIDLRYNGGGALDIATQLGSQIGGASLNGQTFIKFAHNDKVKQYDASLDFINEDYSLSVNTVIFLTSRGSASASEALISGMKPYVNVVQIGDNTYGKPVGMHTWLYGNYAFLPVSFRMVNAAGETDYFDGLPADALAPDGVQYDFSDRREPRLAAAIYYLENGAFPTLKAAVPQDMPVAPYSGLKIFIRAL